jgi:prolyl-tRNA editing enzyme YbaK/EbsC (Cys-tRNA(Pro) deacylase)
MTNVDEVKELTGSAARVQNALQAAGLNVPIRLFPDGTRTAADAAAAVGCAVAQIVKSIIFRTTPSDRVVLVLTSGVNRVNPDKVAAGLTAQLAGDALTRADAAFIRAKTGFAIGGVAPIGHLSPPLVAMDITLQNYPLLWAAAGTTDTVFPLTPQELISLTAPLIMDVAE